MEKLTQFKLHTNQFGSFKDKDFDLFALPIKDHSVQIQKLIKKYKWSKSIQNQIDLRLKDYKSSFDKNRKKYLFRIYLEDGNQIIFLLINDALKTFELDSFIRTQLLADFKGLKKGFSITLESLSQNLQRTLVDSFVLFTHLSRWEPQKFSSKQKAKQQSKKSIHLNVNINSSLPSSELKERFELNTALALANNEARRLSDLPSNVLTPEFYRKEITKRARELKYNIEFFDKKKLKSLGAGAFLAVMQAQLDDQGGILHLSHKPKTKNLKRLTLVGKGVCFDTGGYNVKTGAYMYNMHRDMAGSAVAYQLFETIVRLKLPLEVHAYLALAENLISHRGFRPNDVVTSLDGTTIEVIDTDAEGRMLLSDTLSLAKRSKPDLMIDFATLTGSAVRSLDTRRSAVFSNRSELLSVAVDCGEKSGERVWGFPIGEDYSEKLKSNIADILQCTTTPNADHIYGASFLYHFVGDDIPWVHVDLSSIENPGGLGLIPTDSTAFGLRWTMEFIQNQLL